eukprot:3940248-Rhodomonas_salina.4
MAFAVLLVQNVRRQCFYAVDFALAMRMCTGLASVGRSDQRDRADQRGVHERRYLPQRRQGLGLRDAGLGLRVEGSGRRVQGLGSRVFRLGSFV